MLMILIQKHLKVYTSFAEMFQEVAYQILNHLALFRMCPFGAAHRCAFLGLLTKGRQDEKPLLPKICHTYAKIMKFGKVIPLVDPTNHMTHSLCSPEVSIFNWKSVKLVDEEMQI